MGLRFPGFNAGKNDDLLEAMLRSVCQENSPMEALSSVLSILSQAQGEGSVLSVIRPADRSVVASSEGEPSRALMAMLGTISYVDRAVWYSRKERTNIAFRSGMDCIRIMPLAMIGGEAASLVLEERGMAPFLDRKYYELLSLVVELVLEKIKAEKPQDLPGREELEKSIAMAKGGSMITLELEGGSEELFARMARIVLSLSGAAWHTAAFRLCTVSGGGIFEAVTFTDELLTRLMKEGIQAKAGISEIRGDGFLSVYLSECAMREARIGEVLIRKEDGEDGVAAVNVPSVSRPDLEKFHAGGAQEDGSPAFETEGVMEDYSMEQGEGEEGAPYSMEGLKESEGGGGAGDDADSPSKDPERGQEEGENSPS